MSVPFLCRYFQLTAKTKYIDDAARQFLGCKHHLFIPELKAMSHVYDFRRQMATGIPWGRGNGWAIFSLSELLAVLPAGHALRPALLAFFPRTLRRLPRAAGRDRHVAPGAQRA
jgi:rhamnogalacturonyl hydrolase YesR